MNSQTAQVVTADGITYRPLYVPQANRPMRIVVFASGSGGNFNAAISLSRKYPKLISVNLAVTDRPGIKAIEIARQNNIPVLIYNFERQCGVWNGIKHNAHKALKYTSCARKFHNDVLNDIRYMEKKHGELDLAVLSYHRWIEGNLLSYFDSRMINQHAGDLTVKNKSDSSQRLYRGINPVFMALSDGQTKTRTSTFLVTRGHDTGEILAQGPWVNYEGISPVTKKSALVHEIKQKKESDWPVLSFVLLAIAKGYYGIAHNHFHDDGSRIILYKEKPLAYGGIDLGMQKRTKHDT